MTVGLLLKFGRVGGFMSVDLGIIGCLLQGYWCSDFGLTL